MDTHNAKTIRPTDRKLIMKKFTATSMLALTIVACRPAEKTTEQIWAEFCAVAIIDNSRAVIPKDLYCEYYDCPIDLEAFETEFSTCDETEKEWPTCAWKRSVGCGSVQFVAPCDESCFYSIAFDSQNGALLGFIHGSDTAMGYCGSVSYGSFQVGVFNDYFSRVETDCDDLEEIYCCEN